MKFSLTLLFLFGFIAFIGAAPTEEANPDEVASDPEEDPEPKDTTLNDEDQLEDGELESDEDPSEDEEKPEEDVAEVDQDPRKYGRRRCGRGWKRKHFCRSRGRYKRCWSCCKRCHHKHACFRTRQGCYFYRKYYRKLYKIGYKKVYRWRFKLVRRCYRVQYACVFGGKCFLTGCFRLRRHYKG